MHDYRTLRVYMAGPIQHSNSRGKGWRERVKSRYGSVDWVDPIDKYDSTDQAREWEDEQIVEEDKRLILDCDAVLLHHETVPSWGTPREQEFAVQHNIPVFVQTTEPNLSPWLTVDAEYVGHSFDEVVGEIFRWWEDEHNGIQGVFRRGK